MAIATALTDDQIQGFIRHGIVRPDDAFPTEVAEAGRALLLLLLFSDVGHDDAPTRIRVDFRGDVASLRARVVLRS